MANNELELILKEQSVGQERAKELLEAFGAPFEEAGEILADYQTVKVSDESDKETMALARSKRLALKKVRTTVENRRKELKEGIVKQGRAIDSVARFVREFISPVEEYLQLQEDYVKIKEQERAAAKRAARLERLGGLGDPSLYNIDTMSDEAFNALVVELQAKADAERKAAEAAEKERRAAEQAERERRAQIAAENERLKREAAERQAELDAERKRREELEREVAGDERTAMEKMQVYEPSTRLYYIIESDGDAWFAHYNTVVNLVESDEVAFGKTPQEALQKFIDERTLANAEPSQ